MILRARHLLPIHGAEQANGAIVINGPHIVDAGDFSHLSRIHSGPVQDLGEVVLMPGLVNAHCHLDYTMLRRAIAPQRSFTEWIRRINALKRSLADDDYADAVARGFQELRKWGTTAVANIASFPELRLHTRLAPIRTWWFLEMIDVRSRASTEDTLAGILRFFEPPDDPLASYGLSPHAPYTASGSLYTLTGEVADRLRMPVTTHVSESREEWDMFRHARGELYDFLHHLGRWMNDCHEGRTPLAHMATHVRFGPHWLLAHMNELDESDIMLLSALPREQRPSIVHCPCSHRYFRHSPFPLAQLQQAGVNICLGTDSLASTESLSMFDEMRQLARREPWLDPAEILAMATRHGAVALGLNSGHLVPGALADIIAVPVPNTSGLLAEAVLENRAPIAWMMVNGQQLP